MTTVMQPAACARCDGEGTILLYDTAPVGLQWRTYCPACRCTICGQPTSTPPECRDCGVAEDARQVRRADR